MRNTSPSGFANPTNSNSRNSSRRDPSSGNFNLGVPRINRMVGNDIKFPIFNGKELEDPEQHWFLGNVVWTVRHVQDEAIKKSQMITTIRGRALDWYMKFSMVPTGIP